MSSISSNPQGYLGVLPKNPPNVIRNNRAPLPTDINAEIGDIWIYYTVNPAQFFILGNLFGGVATWQDLSNVRPAIETVTGNDSVIVGSDTNGNINLVGDGSVITVAGNAGTNTETVAITGIVPVTNGGTGANTFTAGQILQGNGTSDISSTDSPTVSTITITNAPVSATDGANKAYVDQIAAGFTFIQATLVATTVNLTAIYSNGAAGVGATLTNSGTQAALVIDGVSLSVSNRVLVQAQTTQFQNGVYVVTDIGSVSTNWILTRSTDYNTVPPIAKGNLIPVQQGTTFARTIWLQTADVITIGTDPIIFQQFSPTTPFQINVQTFTSSGTYTPTPGMTYCKVQAQAGGGGGGGAASQLGIITNNSAGSGGGGGEYAEGLFTDSQIGPSQTVTIGVGGSAGSIGGNGSLGGNTTFGILLTTLGGIGGFGDSSASSSSQPGVAGGSGGVGGYLHVPGGTSNFSFGVGGVSISLVISSSGPGGASFLGAGGRGRVGGSPTNESGGNGFLYGGGGGGGNSCGSTGAMGGEGASGIIIITEYIN